MNKESLRSWLKMVFGFSYNEFLEKLNSQFEKENKHKENPEEKNATSLSDSNEEDILFGMLHYYQRKSYSLGGDSRDSFGLTYEKHINDYDDGFDYFDISNNADWRSKYMPNDSTSRYYSVLFVVTLLYEFSLSDSKEFASFINLEDTNAETEYLIRTVNCILTYPLSPSSKKAEVYSIIYEMCESSFKTRNMQPYMNDDLHLRFQLTVFMFKVVYSRCKIETLCRMVAANIAYEYMVKLYDRNDYKHTIKYSSFALGIDNEFKRCHAFNIAGISTLHCKQYQVAYDIFLSWINRSLIKNVKEYLGLSLAEARHIDNLLRSKQENIWRKKYTAIVGLIYNNEARICIEIFDYLGPTKDGFLFLQIAKYYNELARRRSDNASLLYLMGIIMAYDHKYDEAVDIFEHCYTNLKNGPSSDYYTRLKTSALRRLIMYYPNVSNKKSDKWFDNISNAFIDCYQQLLNSTEQNSNEKMYGRNLYFLLTSSNNLSSRRKRSIVSLLLNIDNDSRRILQCLRRRSSPYKNLDIRREYYSEKDILLFQANINDQRTVKSSDNAKTSTKKIAYYTTLDNLKYLFDSSSDKDKPAIKSEANRLTMMHARYMNDPDEGLVLLDNLKDYLFVSPEELRNNLYDQKYIFLKSFTSLVDQLNMWTLYGSDRENGEDCNGCCICFEPESFIYIPENDYSDGNDSSPIAKYKRHIDDDYSLYNVAYIDGENLLVDGEKSSQLLEDSYADLKKQLSYLYKIVKNASDEDKEVISNCLVRLLEKPMFLFKDISYCLEGESRIIISRDFNDRVEIKKTSEGKDPRKIFINPPLQMFPERIILGPKVENDDYWMPYLQYKLSEIKDKWEYEKDYNPKVRKSKINIR